MFARILAVSALLIGLLAVPAFPQFNGAIQGVITDNSNAVIPGATVRVTNIATGVVREAATSN